MAAAIACRKRSATPFLDEVFPAPTHLAKRGRFSPCPGVAAAAQLASDPLDALRRVFPDASPGEVEACFAASGRDVHTTVEACRARQRQAREREAAAARVASAAARTDGGGMEECAGVLVEQMSAAADAADARGLASWILKLVEGAVANRAAASAEVQAAALREENAALKARAEELARDNGVLRRGVAAQHRRQEELERDNGVLKRGVAALHRRQEETERAAEELRKKVAELTAANYALGVQARGADSCRFQVFRSPDVF
ncbi:hypothetical protein GQ55_7G215400 [Panicum hallii var. hallii]|uniref:CUE domain-containing protein n=1 Tax=Panicum hallii var. hallii TaxID=1504633 RepID=A0A2T7CXJ4_9POAL|nr:hypothetical protein GQ55_7G215400 [Panicum hallii var. hallii]